MRSAQRIAAKTLENGELALEGSRIDGRTQGSQIVMVTGTLQLDPLAVEEESVVMRKLDGPESEGGVVDVCGVVVVVQERNTCHIAVGLLQAPALGLCHSEVETVLPTASCLSLQQYAVGRGYPLADAVGLVGLIDVDAHAIGGWRVAAVVYLYPHGRCGLTVGDGWRGNKHAPVGDMQRLCLHQPDMAVDTCSRVPA